jgi:hypothetical protein
MAASFSDFSEKLSQSFLCSVFVMKRATVRVNVARRHARFSEAYTARIIRDFTMKRSLLALSCSFLFLVPVFAVDAQTGSTKTQSGPSGISSPKQIPTAGQVFTPDRAMKLLQAKGAKTEMKTSDNKGMKVVTVSAVLEQNDFNYAFDVVFATPANGTTLWWYSSILNNNAKNLPLDKLQGLLKENNVMAGDCTFMINPNWALLLNSRSYAGIATDQHIHNDLTRFMRDVKETSQLWYVPQ